jgi:ubiquinone biosynthesis protein UbiJ
MSGPVDVLAVLASVISDHQCAGASSTSNLEDARAAVAELIEESKKSVADLRKHAKQVHDLPLLQQDLRRLANRIERRIANAGSAS